MGLLEFFTKKKKRTDELIEEFGYKQGEAVLDISKKFIKLDLAAKCGVTSSMLEDIYFECEKMNLEPNYFLNKVYDLATDSIQEKINKRTGLGKILKERYYVEKQ